VFTKSIAGFEVFRSSADYKRMRNPAMLYPVDMGLCKRITSADAGRLLENLVFLELRRMGFEVFYFEEKRECDFITRSDDNKLLPFQISLELNEENSEREIKGLIEACKWLGVNEGIILTYDDEKKFDQDGIDIKVLPVWRWLLIAQ